MISQDQPAANEQIDPLMDELEPLKVKCTHTDCKSGLHCFIQKKKRRTKKNDDAEQTAYVRSGACRDCGIRLVDWQRVHRRDLSDIRYLLDVMRRELIRHVFWCRKFDQKAIIKARHRGKSGLLEAAGRRVRTSLGRIPGAFDGRQTSMEGDVICYGQHATATCCRKCVEEWHGIPTNRALTEEEIGYLTSLLRFYLVQRFGSIPGLTDNGERLGDLRRIFGIKIGKAATA